MKRTIIVFVTIIMVSIGCAPALTPQQQAMQAKVYNTPLTFDVAKDKSDDFWAKAQVWITNNAPMKMQTVTNNVLQTYTPTDINKLPVDNQYTYTVTREPKGDVDTFTINCVANSWLWKTDAEHNARVFAYYLFFGEQHGELMTPAR